MNEVFDVIKINVSNLLAFTFFYFLITIAFSFVCNRYMKKERFATSVKYALKFPWFLIRFRYPKYPSSVASTLDQNIYKQIKVLFAQVFIPISYMNAFWIDKETIPLDGVEFKSPKGIIRLKEITLTLNSICISYDVISDDEKFNLIKTQKKTVLSINGKDYFCDVDLDSKTISVAKCCGYCIFNDTVLVLRTKLRYGESFEIKMNTNFFNCPDIKDVKAFTFVQACNFLCQVCLIACFITIFVCFVDGWNFISIVIIDCILIKSISSIFRRLFDVVANYFGNI